MWFGREKLQHKTLHRAPRHTDTEPGVPKAAPHSVFGPSRTDGDTSAFPRVPASQPSFPPRLSSGSRSRSCSERVCSHVRDASGTQGAAALPGADLRGELSKTQQSWAVSVHFCFFFFLHVYFPLAKQFETAAGRGTPHPQPCSILPRGGRPSGNRAAQASERFCLMREKLTLSCLFS